MIFVGVQHTGQLDAAERAIRAMHDAFGQPKGPRFWDRAEFVDNSGFSNIVLACYWDSRSDYRLWRTHLSDEWWHPSESARARLGYFCETYLPGLEDTETTFSHQLPEGYARMAERFSGATDTHGYWGSARDRIPRSQIDDLVTRGTAELQVSRSGRAEVHVVVPHDNLVLLRSGQDWSATSGAERTFYLEEVQPLLERGMAELNQHGLPLGCYFNRYASLQQTGDTPRDRTYSLSAWRSLTQLEQWVKADTHLSIFAKGIEHYRRAGSEAKLRLYHEASVLRSDDQDFRYLNCHAQTGMLAATAI